MFSPESFVALHDSLQAISCDTKDVPYLLLTPH